MSGFDWWVLALALHSVLGLLSGLVVAGGALIESRENPNVFATRRAQVELLIQIGLVTALPLVMWSLAWWFDVTGRRARR